MRRCIHQYNLVGVLEWSGQLEILGSTGGLDFKLNLVLLEQDQHPAARGTFTTYDLHRQGILQLALDFTA